MIDSIDGAQSRREPYEWILRTLRIYCPRQIEFSRLNVTRHLMSKRRIIKLVRSGTLRGSCIIIITLA